jgi:transcriptional regulator with XRE-family HTH domain
MQSSQQNRLKELMDAEGVKRYEIAALCKRDTTTIGRWISGDVPIPDEAKRLLCDRFDVSVEKLLGWDREPSAVGKAAA